MAKKSKHNVNYDDDAKKTPHMGQGKHSNMPDKPIYMTFGKETDMRGGIKNSFTTAVEEISGIEENC